MGFFRAFFASCLGSIVALIVVIVFAGFIISYMIDSESTVVVSDNSVLYLELDAPITEQAIEDPLAELIPGETQPIGLLQVKDVLSRAKEDPKIKGIYLHAPYLLAGPTTLAEIRSSIADFRQSGKWVIAYAEAYTEGAYYLASAADRVFLNPEGSLELNGLSLDVMLFKRMLDKLEIRPQVFRVGDFKSAVEPFIREDLSDENKLQLNSMIESIYGEMLSEISASRKIEKEKLDELANKMLVRNAEDAKENKLVDELLYEDEVRGEIRSRLDLEEDGAINFVRYEAYKNTVSMQPSSSNEIAVIVADGEIVPGKADQGLVGSTNIVKALRRARTNDRVKAIVIRVNSPGGVFQAADEMWREVSLAAEEKPVIASMSDYATSGGYYLAMACDTIVARPTTVTGSIGIFSVLFDLSNFLGNKIGITTEEVKTGEVGGLITFTRPLTDLEKAIWQKQTDEIYETFTRKAAEGRGMSQDEIKKIASGRVWTGTQALENGLVDVLGGYEDALQLAAAQAGIGEDYRLRYYPQPRTFLEKLAGGWEGEVRAKALKSELGELYPYYHTWERVRRYEGVQARFPFELEIR